MVPPAQAPPAPDKAQREHESAAPSAGRPPVVGLAAFLAPKGRPDGSRPEEWRCSNCGERQTAGVQGPRLTCGACGAAYVLDDLWGPDEESHRAAVREFILPFTSTKQQFWQCLVEWLIAGDATPKDLLAEASFGPVQGIFYPFYHLGYAFDASWTAGIGRYEAVVDIYAWENSPTVFGDAEKAARKRSQAITHWTDEAGETRGGYFKTVPGSNALPEALVDGVIREGASAERMVTLVPPRHDLVLDFKRERFQTDQAEAAEACLKQDLPGHVSKRVSQSLPGEVQRDLAVKETSRLVSCQRVYLPFWYASYSHGGRTHIVLADGQKPGAIVGAKPKDIQLSEKARANARKPWRALAWWIGTTVVSLPIVWVLSAWVWPSGEGMNQSALGLVGAGLLFLLLGVMGLGWIPAVALFTLTPKRLKASLVEEHARRQVLAQKLLESGPPVKAPAQTP